MLLKKTAVARAGGFGMMLFLGTMAALVPGMASAAGVELISRAPLRSAPDTTGLTVHRPALSADGRYTAFLSFAPNLVPGQSDSNIGPDVFFHDRVAGTTTLVSHASGAPARAAERPSTEAVLSSDGRFVAFVSDALDIVPGAGGFPPGSAGGGHVYLWDRETGQTTLVTRRAGGENGADDRSSSVSISADGGVIVFTSRATDLAPGLTLAPPGEHVYAYERATSTITLADRVPGSTTRSGDSSSYAPTVSADGRFVAYFSSAGDLVAGLNDPNGLASDLFLFDRLTGATVLVSHAAESTLVTANDSSHGASLSADGSYVLFSSLATNLAAGVSDTNRLLDVFLFDRLSGAVTLVSLGEPGVAGGGYRPEISRDGSTAIYFLSDPSLPRGGQIVAYDIASGSRSLVTRGLESPFTFADKGARFASLSADGRIVAFTSSATNLVVGFASGNGGKPDLFVHDRAAGVTVLASHAAGSPARGGDEESFAPTLSADGRWVGYSSAATDLVAGVRDPAGTLDLFLHERATGANRAVTLHAPGMASRTAPGYSIAPSISADGRYVAFTSSAALIPGLTVHPGRANVYLHDRVTRRTVLVSRSTRPGPADGDAPSLSPVISRDGSAVVFLSAAGDLVPGQWDTGDTYDIFHWDRRTGRLTLVTHTAASPARGGTGQPQLGGVSADGNTVVFASTAPDLVAGQRDLAGSLDVFAWDRRTGAITLVSRSATKPSRSGNSASYNPSLSPGGDFIVFLSAASDLVPRDRNQRPDAFVYERRTGGVSRLRGGGGVPLISAGGRWAAFLSGEDREVPDQRIVLTDRATGDALEIVTSSQRVFFLLGLSDDGRWLLFNSDAPDLVPGQIDIPGTADLFLFDRVSRQFRLVSHLPGEPLRAGGNETGTGRLSPDGRWVAFDSASLDSAVPPQQVYLYDRTTEEVVLASRSAFDPSQGGSASSFEPAVAGNGIVAFASQAPDLVQGDFNFSDIDVFVFVPQGE